MKTIMTKNCNNHYYEKFEDFDIKLCLSKKFIDSTRDYYYTATLWVCRNEDELFSLNRIFIEIESISDFLNSDQYKNLRDEAVQFILT